MLSPQNELISQLLHGRLDRHADHRFADPLDGTMQHLRHAPGLFIIQNLTGQHQCPGGGIDQGGGRLAQMATPGRRCDLVLDQIVDGLGIGNPQKGLRKAHQGDAFVGRQTVFGEKDFHQTGRRIRADGLDEGLGPCRNRPPLVEAGLKLRRQALKDDAVLRQMEFGHVFSRRAQLVHGRTSYQEVSVSHAFKRHISLLSVKIEGQKLKFRYS